MNVLRPDEVKASCYGDDADDVYHQRAHGPDSGGSLEGYCSRHDVWHAAEMRLCFRLFVPFLDLLHRVLEAGSDLRCDGPRSRPEGCSWDCPYWFLSSLSDVEKVLFRPAWIDDLQEETFVPKSIACIIHACMMTIHIRKSKTRRYRFSRLNHSQGGVRAKKSLKGGKKFSESVCKNIRK